MAPETTNSSPENSKLRQINNSEYEKGREQVQEQTKKDLEDLKEYLKLQIKAINQYFNIFKEEIQKIQNSDSIITWWKWKEQKEDEAKSLLEKYTALYTAIKFLEEKSWEENSWEELDDDQKKQINEIKLYLAKYYWDELEWEKWEKIENKFNKNYFKSIWLALQILPNEGKPNFPEQVDFYERIKWQTWLFSYIEGQLINWKNIEDVLEDKHISDTINILKWKQIKGYEKKLEVYLVWLKPEQLTPEQKEALKLLKDIQWIWRLDFKESTLDVYGSIWWTVASVWVWIATYGLTTLVIPWAWIATRSLSAFVWWVFTTLWVMWTNWDNYFVDWDNWLKELWINIATFWVWWALYKWARAIQWWNKLLSARGGLSLLTERGWEISIWAMWDWIRKDFELDYLDDAFYSNLIWWLTPILFRGKSLAQESSLLFQKRTKLAEDILSLLETARFAKVTWNKNLVSEQFKKIGILINRVRAYEWFNQEMLITVRDNLDYIKSIEKWENKKYTNKQKWKPDVEIEVKFNDDWTYTFTDTTNTPTPTLTNIPVTSLDDVINAVTIKNHIIQKFSSHKNLTRFTLEWAKTKIEIKKNRKGEYTINGQWQAYSMDLLMQNLNNMFNIKLGQIEKAQIQKLNTTTNYTLEKDIEIIKWDNWMFKRTGSNKDYSDIDTLILDLSPDNILKYWDVLIKGQIQTNIPSRKFRFEGKNYYYDKGTKTLKVQDSSGGAFVPVEDNFIIQNYERLNKEINGNLKKLFRRFNK